MAINKEAYHKILTECKGKATLVSVSKTKPVDDIEALYQLGQKDFGENYVQELIQKQATLPKDINWHFIGHLQTNKVKFIAPFVYLIHGVDSIKLLKEINKEAKKNNRVIKCLLQVFIAQEETKYGLDENELEEIISYYITHKTEMANIELAGLMGMASFTNNAEQITTEFAGLNLMFNKSNAKLTIINYKLSILSMGMSSDYKIALQEGSTLVRIGSLLFGSR